MAPRRLPIGIQSFRKMRESNYYYVDKTGYALRLMEEGSHYFLSRPRRFGKSLFLDTLKELFEGSKELFEGLRAYQDWDWSVTYPVIKLSFGKGSFNQPGYVHTNLMAQLDGIEESFQLESRYDTAPERFARLIESLCRQSKQRVVVLVDEYDKPILDALEQPDTARENREYLRGLYAVVKDCDAHVHFCFLTGVSKFSQVSLFSGLNNLLDITLDPTYSALCGYTEIDLDTIFGPELKGNYIRECRNHRFSAAALKGTTCSSSECLDLARHFPLFTGFARTAIRPAYIGHRDVAFSLRGPAQPAAFGSSRTRLPRGPLAAGPCPSLPPGRSGRAPARRQHFPRQCTTDQAPRQPLHLRFRVCVAHVVPPAKFPQVAP